MNKQNTEFTPEEQEIVTEKLRQIYAAPSDPAYWSNLQVGVLTRIADSDPGLWWVFLGKWARTGIVAAALALMTAGVVSVMERQNEDQFAYTSVLDDELPVINAPTTAPLTTFEKVSSMVGVSDDEAAVRYVLALVEGSGR
jgi:hypothetical protein